MKSKREDSLTFKQVKLSSFCLKNIQKSLWYKRGAKMENENLNVNQMTRSVNVHTELLKEENPMKWTIRKIGMAMFLQAVFSLVIPIV